MPFKPPPIKLFVTVPSKKDLLHSAAYTTASNFVEAIRRGTFNGFVEHPWLARIFGYRHKLKEDMQELIRRRSEDKSSKDFELDFNNFRPSKKWTVEQEETVIVFRFQSEDDLVLFQMAVVK